ncbi:MAG TPA: hypothetical protein VNM92_04230 [Thermoanaerobaculia bacterium]|nr:hypothetical protein [Thermoanaerobaculia bacterium]
MDKGRDFLRAQVNNAIMLHATLIENLEDHIKQAEDNRYRELCQRYLTRMGPHQRTLEDYGTSIGAAGATGVKKAIGVVLGKARDAVDSMRESDFLRVVGDIVTIRQCQDTFATFAEAGDKIGEPRLSEIGRTCERDHDEMQREFNQLIRTMFVAHTLATPGGETAGRP